MSPRTLLAVVAAGALAGPAAAQQRPEAPAPRLKNAAWQTGYPAPVFRAELTPAPDTDTQIAVEVRMLTLSDDLPDRAGVDLAAGVLTDAQLRAVVEATRGDRRSGVTRCPKLTLLDGQEATIRATESRSFATGLETTRVDGTAVVVPTHTSVETGATVAVCAKASADGRFVRVRVRYTDVRVEEPVELIPVTSVVTPVFEGGSRGMPVPVTQYLQAPQVSATTIEKADLVVPAGGHAVVVGPTRMQEERQEFGPPVLSRVPYVNRMFKTIGTARVAVRTCLVITPTVIAPEPAGTGRGAACDCRWVETIFKP